MYTISISTFASNILLGTSSFALADAYDEFMNTQVAEFQSVGGDRCQIHTKEVIEGRNKILYDLCTFQGKAVFLKGSSNGNLVSLSEYNRGKLVQISLWKGTVGVGFRNGQPVVEWSSGEFSQRRVNWNLTADQKSQYLAIAAKAKDVLFIFGIS